MIPFEELLPDLQDRDNPGLLQAVNVTPMPGSYGPVRDLVEDTNALATPCKGAAPLKDFTNNVFNYAGDTNLLYELSSGEYVPKPAGTTYNLAKSEFWEFLSFQGKAYAIGGYNFRAAVMGGDFGDLTLDPDSGPVPAALHAGVVRNFIVTGNQNDNAQQLRWSAIGRADKWDGPLVEDPQQCGEQILQQGGPIQRVIGGEYGVVFCEHAIYRMTYQGAPYAFSIENVAPGKGTVASGSVTQIGFMIYYLDADGFYYFDGSEAVPIGSNAFNRTFIQDLWDTNYPESVNSLADLENTIVYWAYAGRNAGTDGLPNQLVAYNWTTKRFTGPINLNTERIVYSLTAGVLSDDAGIGGMLCDDPPYAKLDSDSDTFKGGDKANVAAFTFNHMHATTTGDVLPTLLETGEYALNPGGYTHVTGVRPVVDGEDPKAEISLGSRDQTFGKPKYTGFVKINPRTGECNFRANSRYHRLRLQTTGHFTQIIGFEPRVFGGQSQ